MSYKDRGQEKEYQRRYRCKNREKLLTDHREYYKNIIKFREKERGEEAKKILGNCCFFCKDVGKLKRLEFHEKNGKEHNRSKLFILKNIKRFVLLCYGCHRSVHWNMKYFGMKWEEIEVRAPLKGNNNG